MTQRPTMPGLLTAGLLAALCLLVPAAASAQLEIRLGGFGDTTQGDQVIPDLDGFEALAGDLGQVMGPKMLGPAETTGALGFDIGLEFSFSNIDETSSHWQRALSESRSMLTTAQLQVRKGLPYSFEVGGVVSHLFDTDLWGVGMSLKWAMLEGYKVVPDVALRGSVSTVLGSRDMSMLIGGGDITVSKSFGVGGVLSLGPYIGYSALFVRASSFVLGVFPDDSPRPIKFVIPGQNILRHRGFIGFRLVSVHAAVAFEAMIAEGIQTFTTTIGADF